MGLIHFDHIDPVMLVIVASAFIGQWYLQKGTSKWHTEWIQKHDKECDERRETNNTILVELKTANSHLVTLTEAHGHRLDRIESIQDRSARGVGR